MATRLNGAYPTRNTSGLASRGLPKATPNASVTPWSRNKAWPTLTPPGDTEQKFVGLYAVWPGDGTTTGGSNFFAVNCAGNYNVDYGDGTNANSNSGVANQTIYDFSDADLYDATVTLTDSGDVISRTAHGYVNGDRVQFFRIQTTTGLSEGQFYSVINAAADTFQVSLTAGGSAVTLTSDGSASLLPYKVATVTITPQAGQNLTTINLNVRHTDTSIVYSSGWLDIALSSPNLTTLTVGATSPIVRMNYLERFNIVKTGNTTSFADLFRECVALESLSIEAPSTVTNMTAMFTNCSSLQSVPLFNTAAVTSMSNMFNGCFSLTSVPLFDTAAVTNMSSMFSGCRSLPSVPLFDTAAVTSMSNMFNGCSPLQSVPLFDTAAVTSMTSMFATCSSLQSVPLFNTAAVTNMISMFTNCSSLQSVPLFDTAAVTSMTSMFATCSSLQSVPLFDTAAVTSMSSMFSGCSSLQSVPLFDTAAVTSMISMFTNCSSLQSVPLFNTAAVTTMSSMFTNCSSLQSVPLFNTAAVLNMSSMFSGCRSLPSVPLFDTAAAVNINSMFAACSSLQSVPLFNTAAVVNMGSIFSGCSALAEVPGLVTTAVTSGANFNAMFTTCSSLARIQAKDFRFTFSVASCKLSVAALDEIFTNLPRVTTSQTITVTNNFGAATVSRTGFGTTSGSTTVTQANTTGLVAGQEISGAGVSTAVAVTFQDTGDTVTRTAHGLANDTPISFATIVTTTGITTWTTYYVVNATADTFQVADTVGGAARALTTDGSGTAVYPTTIVSVTANTSIELSVPASATASVTLVAGQAKRSIARLKNWAVSG
jgi:surface protein